MHLRNWLLTLIAFLLGAAAVTAASNSVRAAGHDVAILVVGNGSNAEMVKSEHAVVDQLTRARASHNWNHKILPIYSYHFDKTVERTYCEERLKVQASDLIVAGLVELESGVPVRFVYRENGVKSARTVAATLMEKAAQALASQGGAPVAVARPAATPTPTPRPAWKPTVRPVSPVTPVAAARPPSPVTPPPVIARTPERPVESPRAAAVVPAAAAVTWTGSWGVQLGVFSSLDKAHTCIEKARENGSQLEIRRSTKDATVVFRVLTGRFNTKQEAVNRAKELKEKGFPDAFAKPLDPALGPVVP